MAVAYRPLLAGLLTVLEPPDSMASIDTQSPLSTLKKREREKSPLSPPHTPSIFKSQCVLRAVLPWSSVRLHLEETKKKSQPPD